MWGCPCFLCTIPFCLPRLKLRQCIFRIIGKRVKSFHKRRCCITLLLSVLYNTYCFAFQKHKFYWSRQALLHRKTAVIAIPKRSYRFLTELFLQNLVRQTITFSVVFRVARQVIDEWKGRFRKCCRSFVQRCWHSFPSLSS